MQSQLQSCFCCSVFQSLSVQWVKYVSGHSFIPSFIISAAWIILSLSSFSIAFFARQLSHFMFSLFVLQGSIKKKIESLRRWSSASMKRPPKPKAKTLSLSSPVGDPDDVWLQEGDRRRLRPIVDSVFGQVGRWTGRYMYAHGVFV